ncbi:MAG: 50S ribosomal protein L11 methyltransferase [Bacteroidota bacterium]
MDYTEVRFVVVPREPFAEILTARLAASGYESFADTDDGLLAYVPAADFSAEEVQALCAGLPAEVSWSQRQIPAQNWNRIWESSFSPVAVGDECLVRAPFHGESNKTRYEIVIEPKMSFGTGHHETTWLMLQQLLKLNVKDRAVLDMGCGTGVLAILASMMGAAEVTAVDTEPWACENAIENAERNRQHILVEKGDINILAGRGFHVILANINKNVLLNDISSYSGMLKKDGELLLSGFFESDADELVRAGRSCGLQLKEKRARNGWALLHFFKTEAR